MENNLKTAMYLRKSRSDNDTESVDETLAKHYKLLTEFAQKYNLTITGIYKEVVSGDGLFTRPEMIRLLNDIENDKYTAVICTDIDRLGRSSSKDSGIILETLKEHNCKIITPEKTYNLDDDIDQMTVELKTFFARQELRSIRKRLSQGEIETLRAGGHTGEPPYGYRRKWLGKIPSLEIIPEEAAVIRLIFDLYTTENIGTQKIAERLNQFGYTASDGGNFCRTSVRAILMNPTYTGKIVWNKTRRIKKRTTSDKHKKISNKKENWIISQGLHKKIISDKVFKQAEEIRLSRSHSPSYTGIIKNPYSTLVYCLNCGTPLQRQTDRKNHEPRLLCPTKKCTSSVKLNLFDQRIKSLLITELNKIKIYPEKPKDASNTDIFQLQLKTLENHLISLQNQNNKLHDFFEQGIYDLSTFSERQIVLNKKTESVKTNISRLKTIIDNLSEQLNEEGKIYTIESIIKSWDFLNAAYKNELLHLFIKRINYKRDSRNFKIISFETNIIWNF